MKKLFLILTVLLSLNVFGFELTVDTPATIYNKGRVADLVITETISNEFTNAKIIINIDNAILFSDVDNYNITSGSIYTSEYTVVGKAGTNKIEIDINNDSDDIDSIRLVNVYVIPYCDSCDVTFHVIIIGNNNYDDRIVVAKKKIKPVLYTAYFTNKTKWWTGVALINSTNESYDLYITFHTDGELVKQYTINAKELVIVPIYNDPDLADKSGWFEVTLPYGVKCITLIGDGVQSYSF